MAFTGTALSVLGRDEVHGDKSTSGTKSTAPKVGQKEMEIARGKMLFVKATCWGCHPHGENSLHGDKPLKGPWFEKTFKSDKDIADFVRKGSPEAGMPPFSKEKLSDSDLKSVIVFIRSLSAPNAK